MKILALCLAGISMVLSSCAMPGNVAQDPMRVALSQMMVQQHAQFMAQPHTAMRGASK